MSNEVWHSVTCDKRITLRLPCTCTPKYVTVAAEADYSHLEMLISAAMLSYLWDAGALQDMKRAVTNTGRLK